MDLASAAKGGATHCPSLPCRCSQRLASTGGLGPAFGEKLGWNSSGRRDPGPLALVCSVTLCSGAGLICDLWGPAGNSQGGVSTWPF